MNVAGQDLYIRMAASELGNKIPSSTEGKKTSVSDSGNRHIRAFVRVPILITMFISISFMCHVWRRKLKSKEKETNQDLLLFDSSIGSKATTNGRTDINKLGKGGNNSVELPLFSFASIAAATDNFSATNKLGEGGFGPVYKEIIDNEDDILKGLEEE